jgi:hypothetical protein
MTQGRAPSPLSLLPPLQVLLVLALGGLVGYDYQARAAGDTNSVRIVKMKQSFREL